MASAAGEASLQPAPMLAEQLERESQGAEAACTREHPIWASSCCIFDRAVGGLRLGPLCDSRESFPAASGSQEPPHCREKGEGRSEECKSE